MNFVTSFQATFIFGTSQSELSIKSYVYFKFFRTKFWQIKIYDKSIQFKNSTIKYTPNQVTAKLFRLKTNF